jgi:heterotetrameric sarcosine oxidase delta subunit
MILLPCPHCGPRDAAEFSHHGEPAQRPDPDTVSPEQWRAYLYLQRNPAGWTTEIWFHRAGCGRFLTLQRETSTNDVRAVDH